MSRYLIRPRPWPASRPIPLARAWMMIRDGKAISYFPSLDEARKALPEGVTAEVRRTAPPTAIPGRLDE